MPGSGVAIVSDQVKSGQSARDGGAGRPVAGRQKSERFFVGVASAWVAVAIEELGVGAPSLCVARALSRSGQQFLGGGGIATAFEIPGFASQVLSANRNSNGQERGHCKKLHAPSTLDIHSSTGEIRCGQADSSLLLTFSRRCRMCFYLDNRACSLERRKVDTIVLTHGAGSDRNSPLLVAVDAAITASGLRVVRVDLWFREHRRSGPPYGADAARDRETLRAHAAEARRNGSGRLFLGGHSYGGRQASMLAAEEPDVADALLLLSYPLHPPRRPDEPRTKHFHALRTPALFVHGTRDQFGSTDELLSAIALIPARTGMVSMDGAGHDLRTKRGEPLDQVAGRIAREFVEFVGHGA